MRHPEWWEKRIPRISDAAVNIREPRYGVWMSPHQYRFTHPVTRRTQDMVFENVSRHDPAEIARIVGDQERKALKELANPIPDKKAVRQNIARRSMVIAGRKQAVEERWY